MKYIRTKSGVYEVLAETSTLYYTDFTGAEGVIKSDKIKEADTIDELCDCYVIVGNKHTIWDKQHCIGLTAEQVKQSYSAYDFKIYGAIWTSKGLIYVAKMNDKGELELI